jgi:tellurite resistance protein
MPLPLTINEIVERARGRFWAFNDVQMPAGAILQFLDDRQRTTLLALISEIEALIGETREIQTALDGTVLVAEDDDGAPYFSTTTEPAYAIKFSGGVPYIDTSETFIVDPFGEEGSVPGLPLPDHVLRIIALRAVLDDGREAPINLLEEHGSASGAGATGLRAFISANRLVPVRAGNTDWWSHVTKVRLSLVLCPQLAALTDTLTLPAACVEVMVCAAAEFMASASPKVTEQDKRRFERATEKAEATMRAIADEILSQVTTNYVVVRR